MQTRDLLRPASCSGLAAAAAVAGAALPASAEVVLFEDDFSDGNRSTPAWYLVQTDGTAGTTLEVAPVGTDNALEMDITTGSAATRAAVAQFSEVTLANTGDYIQLSFDGRVSDQEVRQDRKFVFGLYDIAGTPVTEDISREEGAEEIDNDGAGFAVKADYGRYGGTSGGVFRQRVESRVFSTNTGLDLFDTSTSSSSAVLEAYRTFSLLITRLDGEDLALTYSVDGSTLISTTVSSKEILGEGSLTPDTYTFGMLAIGIDAPTVAMDLSIDNVVVTSNVPEPATALFAAAGGLAMLMRRRVA